MYRQKIKIFTGKEAEELENKVNIWIKENTSDGRCVILKMMQTESAQNWTITIYYNEQEQE